MTVYLLRRLMQAAGVVLAMSVLVFIGVFAVGDPVEILISPDADQIERERAIHALGLDLPLWQQYLVFLGNALRGDLGRSFVFNEPALQLILQRMPATLELAFGAMFLALLVGLPLGLYAGLRPKSPVAKLIMAGSILGFSLPTFLVGLMLIMVFAVQLGWLPSGGQESWRHAILPVVTLGLGGAAVLARFTRSAMLEVLGQPYIRTASAKGVPWAAVVRNHALPNAAIPTVTIVGFMVGSLMAGAVVVESVFSWPGVGRLLVVAVANRDHAVVQCILLVVAGTMVAANFCVDLLYGALDPRLRSARTA